MQTILTDILLVEIESEIKQKHNNIAIKKRVDGKIFDFVVSFNFLFANSDLFIVDEADDAKLSIKFKFNLKKK